MPVVKFYANLRRLTGAKEKIVPGTRMRAILEALVRDFPDLQAFLLDGERVQAIITLNGQTLNPQTALDTLVTEQDQIAIFPPISGG